MERAQKRNRAPRLRNAMFHMFAPHFVFDGFKCFVFILIRQVERNLISALSYIFP